MNTILSINAWASAYLLCTVGLYCSDVQHIVSQAYQYLHSHECHGQKWGLPYHFYRPSADKYSADQWLWDSSAHMIVWSHRNVTNAVLDLTTMLQMQQPDGRIPEIIFWTAGKETAWQTLKKTMWFSSPKLTDLTQMPIIVFALRAIAQASPSTDISPFLRKILAYLEWWYQARRVDDSGLVWILHPWESGLDASPAYDEALEVPAPASKFQQYLYYTKFLQLLTSYKWWFHWDQSTILHRSAPRSSILDDWFVVADVGVNAVYTAAWGVLADLSSGKNTSMSEHCRRRQQEMQDSVIRHMWDSQRRMFVTLYKDRSGKVQQAAAETAQSLLPLLLPGLPADITRDIVYGQLLNTSRFWTRYPVPSCSQQSPQYNPGPSMLMWRGPTWAMVNWLVMEGLNVHGYLKERDMLLDRWIDLYSKSGIWEQYNPETGEGFGPEGLGMSTLIVDWIYRTGRLTRHLPS